MVSPVNVAGSSQAALANPFQQKTLKDDDTPKAQKTISAQPAVSSSQNKDKTLPQPNVANSSATSTARPAANRGKHVDVAV